MALVVMKGKSGQDRGQSEVEGRRRISVSCSAVRKVDIEGDKAERWPSHFFLRAVTTNTWTAFIGNTSILSARITVKTSSPLYINTLHQLGTATQNSSWSSLRIRVRRPT